MEPISGALIYGKHDAISETSGIVNSKALIYEVYEESMQSGKEVIGGMLS